MHRHVPISFPSQERCCFVVFVCGFVNMNKSTKKTVDEQRSENLILWQFPLHRRQCVDIDVTKINWNCTFSFTFVSIGIEDGTRYMFTSELYHQRRIISLRAVVTSAQAQLYRLRRWKIFVIDFNFFTSYLYISTGAKGCSTSTISTTARHQMKTIQFHFQFNRHLDSSRWNSLSPVYSLLNYWKTRCVFLSDSFSLFPIEFREKFNFFQGNFEGVKFPCRRIHPEPSSVPWKRDSSQLWWRLFIIRVMHTQHGSRFLFAIQKTCWLHVVMTTSSCDVIQMKKKLLEANVVNEIETLPTSGLNY